VSLVAGFPGFGTHPLTSLHWTSTLSRLLFAFNEPSAVSAGNAPAALAVQSLVHRH
jgi:hypothetical protein